ncbi:hypothetical protein AB2L28_20580 [Kineococcus sp. TBRC 1896]|uniref:Uncharacterized protein n=1 Tax=Kineococcus mangrovi TaxID=1660183 RepID=A0ABV4I7X5_9ACTN
MSWSTFWPMLGVVAAMCLLLAPILYLLVRRELRRSFAPLRLDVAGLEQGPGSLGELTQDLQSISDKLDSIHDSVRDAGGCVHDGEVPEGRRA